MKHRRRYTVDPYTVKSMFSDRQVRFADVKFEQQTIFRGLKEYQAKAIVRAMNKTYCEENK
jgi:hypothetical protein